MSEFFKAGPRVKQIIGHWDQQHSPAALEDAIGCDAQCIFHYQGEDVYLEMPNGSNPKGCTAVDSGSFLKGMLDD